MGSRTSSWRVRGCALALVWAAACARQHDGAEPPAPTVVADDAKDAVDGIKVALSASEVCAGESVRVDVVPEGDDMLYAIDGMLTESRTLQLTGQPSRRLIHVDAWPRGDRARMRSRDVVVTLRACDDARQLPRPELVTNGSYRSAREIKLTVANADLLDADSYTFRFGDGRELSTTSPAVDHEFAPERLDYRADHTLFDVRVTAHTARGDRETVKTVAVRSHYAFRREQGVLQPPVVRAAQYLRASRTLNAAVYNPETEDLALTSYELRHQPCDGSDPRVAERVAHALPLPAHQTTELAIVLAAPPASVCGVELVLHGVARDAGRAFEVELPLYAEVRAAPQRASLVDRDTARLLDEIVARGLVPDGTSISDDDLHLLERGLRMPAVEAARLRSRAGFVPLASTPAPDQECAPGDGAVPPTAGSVCQPTGEWIRDEPYLANAHVGDVVLSSACGDIGMMLRALDVPQTFSHAGIMTRHYDGIRHSTALTKRFEDHRAGTLGAQGVDPDVLRYAMPGAVDADIDAAYRGTTWHDDLGAGKDYRFSGFSADAAYCPGDDSVVYPLVISGPSAGFAQRKAVATVALTIPSHYRFFAYSRADISLASGFDMPSSLGGPSVATQCASFIWTAAKHVGITLEGDLEDGDVARGAKRDATTPDGLYFYEAAERRSAAARLYSAIYGQVSGETGLGGKLVDAPDNWANQITNCFATDFCSLSARDSTAWKNTSTVGRTVSPQDLLFWDAPYGRSEPLAFRVGTYRRRHAWQAPRETGTVKVLVVDGAGSPVAGAKVMVGDRSVSTGASGLASVVAVAGPVDVAASKRIANVVQFGNATAAVTAGETASVTVTLAPPAPAFRSVRLEGTLRVTDDELFGSEKASLSVREDILLNPGRTTRTLTFSKCAGDEVRADGTMALALQADDSVRVTTTIRLYEGASCATDDREDTKSAVAAVARDEAAGYTVTAVNSGVGGGDKASFQLTIVNGPAR